MKNIDATIQYLHWALIAAEAESNPDCREVKIRLDLARRTSTTSFVGKDAPEESDVNSLLLNVAEIVHTALTGPEKFNRDGCIKHLHKAIAFARNNGARVPVTRSEPR